jgi:hypothetical protein
MSEHELTAQVAYEIYVQRGRVPGRHLEDWLAAERIVATCLAFAQALAEAVEPEAQGEPTSVRERALTLLREAVEARGRKTVAGELGYKSASTVGRYVRGDRPIGEALAARIVEALARSRSYRRPRLAA